MNDQSERVQYSHHFSEIKGLQEASTLLYACAVGPNGLTLSVEEASEKGVRKEACFCPELTVANAKDLLLLACENCFGLGAWFDILRDNNIPYQVI